MSFNRSILRTCSRVLGAPFRLIAGTAKRLTRNWRYGKVRNLILGLPAVGALAICLWMSTLVRANPETLRTDYLTSANELIAAGDYATAEIYMHRLLDDLGSNDPQVEFALADVFENTNRPERADLIYRKLAPDDGSAGYGPAHRKRAQVISQTITDKSTAEDVRSLYMHLIRADDPDSLELAQAWAVYHLAIGESDKGVERLEEAIAGAPGAPGPAGLNVLLGNVYSARGKQELAQAAIERARGEQELAQAAIERARGEQELAQAAYARAAEYFREQLDANRTNRGLRIVYFQTLMSLGDFATCETVLEQGLVHDPEGPYKLLLAGLYTAMHDYAAQQEGVPIDELLALLTRALAYEPNFAPVYERLLLYSDAKLDGEKTLEELLLEMITNGKATGIGHFTVSLIKWNEEDYEACRFHLEQSLNFQPVPPPALNNLAWILANQEPVDLARAEELINRALEYGPGDPKFLDTRASIYIKLQRWNDAYNDLELAIQNNPDPTPEHPDPTLEIELHQSMVNVCEQIGQPSLAESHRRLVETLEAQKAAAETSAETPPAADPTADAEPVDSATEGDPAEPMADAESPDPTAGTETPDPGS